jgi:hypothetical protein
VRNRETAGGCGFARREIRALGHRKRELAQRPPHFGFFAFHLVEAVDRLHRDHDGVLDSPRNFPPLDLFLGDVDDGLVRAGLVQKLDHRLDRGAELLVAKVSFLAQAEQQHPVGQRAANVVQKQRRAEFSLHVAAADDFADISIRRAIDQLGRQRQLAIVEDADDDAGAPLLFRTAAFYGKFHRRPEPPNCWVSLS